MTLSYGLLLAPFKQGLSAANATCVDRIWGIVGGFLTETDESCNCFAGVDAKRNWWRR